MTGQQLKNSILQMAVQGKLVPQDPNDEPASVLLERIRKEKEQLIKEGKIKKEKTPSYIFRGADNLPYEKVGKSEPVCIADEVPFDIPESWEWVRISSLGSIVRGSGIKRTETVESGKPCVRYGELYTTYHTSFNQAVSFVSEELFERCKHFSYGDILMTLTGENKPDIAKAVVYLGNDLIAAGGDLAYWTAHGMNPLYLTYLMASPYVVGRKVNLATGDIIVHISGDKLGTILIPIPPLSEQQRIVDKILEAEVKLAEYTGKENSLNLLQKNFPDALKKSILQWAVQGKLVPQDPADEPASILLERIRAEKQKLVAEGKIKKDKHESVIFRRDNSHYEKLDGIERCIDDEIPFDIPESWMWTRLGSITELITSGSRDWAKYYAETGALFLRMGNLSKDSFDLRLNNIQRVQVPKKAEGIRTALQAGDLLFSITGEVGMLGLIPDKFETAYINQHTAILRFLPALRNKYIPYFLLTEHAKKCYKGNQHGIKNSFRLDAICDILVPIPSSQEQKKIVDRIEELFNKITLI
ncbi:restriction endonuclease subunit S [uncultured Subdoligranulum sp.]|uniref:restriction endonuclease subunit S n=1 Tax=uncultured Subdoligranulum sp. TaxID=512298 RepID=UPI002631C4E7|nr:restriction endonuclease subunit S [uncultured Subdoligranulum sp.]